MKAKKKPKLITGMAHESFITLLILATTGDENARKKLLSVDTVRCSNCNKDVASFEIPDKTSGWIHCPNCGARWAQLK